MDTKTYLNASLRTERLFATGKDLSKLEACHLQVTAMKLRIVGEQADALKKALIYDADTLSEDNLPIASRGATHLSQTQIEMLHMALGMVTESIEYFEATMEGIALPAGSEYALGEPKPEAKPLDRVNMIEELGDQLWYIAGAMRKLDSNFPMAMTSNINKLTKRFPDAFSTDKAEERDLPVERASLETDVAAKQRR